ncbi:hypothetical protein [Marinactinospora rubrisoli]|uniref:Uncharacterized protein n=1 Tax=Marinactinospora rubrisoli TaxID=2715399 RepID=A0ABW2KC96_9ACTN
MVRAEAERVHALLPSAPAASFQEAVGHAFAGHFPDPAPVCASPSVADSGIDDDREGDQAPTAVRAVGPPDDARLADLPGKLVRVTSVVELHVHEPHRLLAAARATGWTPLRGEDDQDPDDLVGAAMALAGPAMVPGADDVGNEMSGELLRPESGDELMDWSATPITAEFYSGLRLRRSPEPLHPRETRFGTMPDFAKTFPVVNCECEEDECPTCESWTLSPRTADVLHHALATMADFAYDDIQNSGGEPVTDIADGNWMFFDRLPVVTWQQSVSWRRQVARACDDLAADLAAGRWPRPRSVAEECVLYLALVEEAEAVLEEKEDLDDEDHAELPTHRDDYDWNACLESLFQDTDIALLYDPDMDGLLDPGSEMNRVFGIADMRPAEWFTPFKNVEPRDPERGFRR